MGLAPPSLVEDKRALRRAMRDRREALSLDERARRSSAAAARLAEVPEFAQAKAVAGFMATASEIDPAPALSTVVRRGGTVAFPRVTMEQPRLRFHRVASPDDLRVGAYGILEPRAECPEVAAEEVDLFLIPGLAFDRTGGRLGYGGGYYDEVGALVRRHGRAAMFGFGFDFQIVDSCPMGPDDVTIDGIVTDARVLRCGLSQTESTSK